MCSRMLAWLLVFMMVLPAGVFAQPTQGGSSPPPAQGELEQLLAPIALYPDALLVQILMASTYPLEIVEAARWSKANQNLKGNSLTASLEKQNWDPSVKSLVNFPSVLSMMNDKLEWTRKLGDAFLAYEKDVMETVQKLRAKAQAQGTLKTTSEQRVVVQEKAIVIEPVSPQVIYVPAYNPVIVYGVWPYPAYPPYPVYPPGYVAGVSAFSFMAGVAVGAAWGYAWGNCNWGHNNVNVNVYQNNSINNNINRNNYNKYGGGGKGQWQHDPNHRKGVAYKDSGTAQKYGQASRGNPSSRQDYRGRSPDSKGGMSQAGSRPGSQGGAGAQAAARQAPQQPKQASAFQGMEHGGSQAMAQSDRGRESRGSIGGGGHGGMSGAGGLSRPVGGGGHGMGGHRR